MNAVVRDDMNQTLQVVDLEAKNFKTGSRGFYGNGKLSINGKKYQASCLLVEIGSGNGKKGKK